MSKFDTKIARTIASFSVTSPEYDLKALAQVVIGACDHIDALEARIAKLEAVREAANLYLRTGRGDLEAALAACDDGEGTAKYKCAACNDTGTYLVHPSGGYPPETRKPCRECGGKP